MSLIVVFFSMFMVMECYATIEVGGTIGQDTIWTSDDVYLVTSNITVSAGITLTIEAGTVVKFNSGRQLNVSSGALVAKGAAGNEIVFTSYRDDEYGGDWEGRCRFVAQGPRGTV